DLLTRMGDHTVIDESTFFRAKEAYAGIDKPFQVEFWCGHQRMRATVHSNNLGIHFNEYNPVLYQFDSILMSVDARREVPEHQRDVEFKDAFKEPLDKLLDEAQSLIDRGERERKLSPSQIVLARIYMILDDAPPKELKKQSKLLARFLAAESTSYIRYAGQTRFFEKKHYRPAIQCFKRYLEVNPDDASVRLNLGIAAYRLGMGDAADAAAQEILRTQGSGHGLSVPYPLSM